MASLDIANMYLIPPIICIMVCHNALCVMLHSQHGDPFIFMCNGDARLTLWLCALPDLWHHFLSSR